MAAVVLGASLGIGGTAHAATVVVPCGSTADIQAQIDLVTGDGSDDVVELDGDCTYTGSGLAISSIGESTTVEGNGAVVKETDNSGTVAFVRGRVILRDLTLTGGVGYGTAADNGGGGLILGGSGDVRVERVTITGNQATLGGGIGIPSNVTGSLRVVDSLISGNTAHDQGGGIYGAPGSPMVLQLTNTTISGNHADVGFGGLYFASNTSATLMDGVTVIGNTATATVGGVGTSGGVFTVRSSVVVGNSNGGSPGSGDCSLSRDTIASYLVSDEGCLVVPTASDPGGTDVVDPAAASWFGPLQDNGGTTLSHAPLAGTPVIDLVPEGAGGCGTDLTADQIGTVRPQGTGCEPGAIEYVDSTATAPVLHLPTDIVDQEATGPDGATVTYTATADDAEDGALTPTCTPSSGSTFPLGTTTVECTATDSDSNTTTGSFDVTVVDTTGPPPDTTAPDTTIESGPSGTTASDEATFTYSSSESGSTFECKLDAGDFEGCAVDGVTYAGLAEGEHTFSVRATDASHNTDVTAAVRTWAIDVITEDDCTIGDPDSTTGHILRGTSGHDVICGGSGGDIIIGGGNDVIRGGGGNDIIAAGDGDDTIDGGAGNDTIVGGAGNDTIVGGAGNDVIRGNEGDDIIDGGAGNDVIRGDAGDDKITGGDGNDVIRGDAGSDNLNGGAGRDILLGDDGSDTIDGGAGNGDLCVPGADAGPPLTGCP